MDDLIAGVANELSLLPLDLAVVPQERLRALQLAEDSILTRLQQQQQQQLQQHPGMRNDPPLSPVKASSPSYYTSQQQGGGGGYERDPPPPLAAREERDRKGKDRPSSALDRPYGTDISMADMLAHSKRLDDALVALRWEQEQLEAELSKLPEGAGKTSAQRRRKAEVEERLRVIEGQISNVRTQLKKLTGKWP